MPTGTVTENCPSAPTAAVSSAAGRAHGDDRRRRRAALDLGVLAVAIERSARRRSGTPPRRCVRDPPGVRRPGSRTRCRRAPRPTCRRRRSASLPAMVATATRPFSSARTTKRAGPSLVVRVSRALMASEPALPTRASTLPRRRSTVAPPGGDDAPGAAAVARRPRPADTRRRRRRRGPRGAPRVQADLDAGAQLDLGAGGQAQHGAGSGGRAHDVGTGELVALLDRRTSRPPRCASTLPVAEIDLEDVRLLAPAGSGAPVGRGGRRGRVPRGLVGASNSRRDTRVATTTMPIAISASGDGRVMVRARLHARCARPASAGNVSTNFVPDAGRALGVDRAAVVLDDAVDERQPQPGADAVARLGGEERIEDARQVLGADAGAGVGDRDAHQLVLDRA